MNLINVKQIRNKNHEDIILMDRFVLNHMAEPVVKESVYNRGDALQANV